MRPIARKAHKTVLRPKTSGEYDLPAGATRLRRREWPAPTNHANPKARTAALGRRERRLEMVPANAGTARAGKGQHGSDTVSDGAVPGRRVGRVAMGAYAGGYGACQCRHGSAGQRDAKRHLTLRNSLGAGSKAARGAVLVVRGAGFRDTNVCAGSSNGACWGAIPCVVCCCGDTAKCHGDGRTACLGSGGGRLGWRRSGRCSAGR